MELPFFMSAFTHFQFCSHFFQPQSKSKLSGEWFISPHLHRANLALVHFDKYTWNDSFFPVSHHLYLPLSFLHFCFCCYFLILFVCSLLSVPLFLFPLVWKKSSVWNLTALLSRENTSAPFPLSLSLFLIHLLIFFVLSQTDGPPSSVSLSF